MGGTCGKNWGKGEERTGICLGNLEESKWKNKSIKESCIKMYIKETAWKGWNRFIWIKMEARSGLRYTW